MQGELNTLALSHFEKNVNCRDDIRILTSRVHVYVLINESSREYFLADEVL